ncbi:twin-arginine translocase subunit TatC [Hyperthermus butylicus]|uniref:Sec-independent protein translocase protein TatC n=1 Tax=Hyperthermus butylicus (strain DSM 5456 / JCM 9403 / PLM1-5) TaxID=415426 RepID=A2BMW9_HYPBU|nr:twin-arginine translocase subunit TatC [Hyperthermus butylicus]ABM81330.1 putative Sec-independent protein secretion pathway component TatC [Hyperthermus butylicus DSM 5456]
MAEDREASIWEHLTELAIRLRRIIIAFIISALVLSVIPAGKGGLLYVPLAAKLPSLIVAHTVPKQITTFDGHTYNVTILPSTEFESIQIMVEGILLLGVMGSTPIAAREIWAYVEPALYPHEKRFAKRFMFLFVAAFLFGVFFAIYIVAPFIYTMMLKLYPPLVPSGYKFLLTIRISTVVDFVIKLAIAFGLLFETPIVIYLLLAYGIISPDHFTPTTMKYILLGTMIVGAIISPDPSGLGMLIIGLSLYIPLHIAIKLGKKKAQQRKQVEEAMATTTS